MGDKIKKASLFIVKPFRFLWWAVGESNPGPTD